jgi:hypothetical protein
MNTYQRGDLVRAFGVFRDIAGKLIDPSTVRFRFTPPGASTTTYVFGADAQLVRDGLGRYRVDVDALAVGTWHYRWESSGVGQAAEEADFIVENNF